MNDDAAITRQVVGTEYTGTKTWLRSLAGQTGTAELRPEPTNPHDRNAVQVYLHRRHIGYLSAGTAADWVVWVTHAARSGPVTVPCTVYVDGPLGPRAEVALPRSGRGFDPTRTPEPTAAQTEERLLAATRTVLPPGITLVTLWGTPTWQPRVQVDTPSECATAARSAFRPDANPTGEVMADVPVVLWPDRGTAPPSVATVVGGGVVGRLHPAHAADTFPALSRLYDAGLVAVTRARMHGMYTTTGYYNRAPDTFAWDLQMDLPPGHLISPVNSAPGNSVLLPVGKPIQVTGEQDHQDVLSPLLPPPGEAWLWVTLAEVDASTARSRKTLIEVRVDARPVGRLTATMSARVAPLVHTAVSAGFVPAARAAANGTPGHVEVTVHVARADDAPGWSPAP